MSERAKILTETADARADAERLLAGLIDARDKSEKRLAELSRQDILKSLTGKSAIDNAIASTQLGDDDQPPSDDAPSANGKGELV